jgi:hypothetical protein
VIRAPDGQDSGRFLRDGDDDGIQANHYLGIHGQTLPNYEVRMTNYELKSAPICLELSSYKRAFLNS